MNCALCASRAISDAKRAALGALPTCLSGELSSSMTLTEARAEAVQKLRNQMETGRSIRSRILGLSSREEFDAAANAWIAEWERWQKFSATLLRRLFDGGRPSGEFNHQQLPRLPGYLNRLEGVERARAAMDGRLNELESILERAEAGFFDPVPQQARTAEKVLSRQQLRMSLSFTATIEKRGQRLRDSWSESVSARSFWMSSRTLA